MKRLKKFAPVLVLLLALGISSFTKMQKLDTVTCDHFFLYFGGPGSESDPTLYVDLGPFSGDETTVCPTPLVDLCALCINNEDGLIYPSDYEIEEYRNLPKVDQSTLTNDISGSIGSHTNGIYAILWNGEL